MTSEYINHQHYHVLQLLQLLLFLELLSLCYYYDYYLDNINSILVLYWQIVLHHGCHLAVLVTCLTYFLLR